MNNEPKQSTAWVAPLRETTELDELIDEDGRIAGSPANAEDEDE